jgi:site-specific DNA-methyltransferase (adenine-specific)
MNISSNISCIEEMDFTKLSKTELLAKCKELDITKYKSKNKKELIILLEKKLSEKESSEKELDEKESSEKELDEKESSEKESSEKESDEKESDEKESDEKESSEKESSENFINDTVSLYFGDCIIEMNKIKNDSIDLILCDLPYGTTKCKWDTIIDLNELWKQYKRIIKKPSGVIILFGQQPFTSMLISSNYEWFKYNLIWKKNKTTQFLLANYRPMKCTEDICVFSKGGAAAASKTTGNMTYNPQGLIPTNIKKKNSKERIGKMLNQEHHLGKNNKLISDSEYTQKFTNYPNELIEFDIEYDTIHETQKPVKLIEYLIKTYSNEGDLVLDNTMGSGTTGIGCLNTNRKFIGIEKEEKYIKLSKNRILNKK